jgi:hypothetical protein
LVYFRHLLADVLFRVQKPIDRELSGIQLRIVPPFGHFRSPLCFTKTASSRAAGFSWSFDQPASMPTVILHSYS